MKSQLQEPEEGKDTEREIDSYLVRLTSWDEVRSRLQEGETLASVAKWLKASEPDVAEKSDDAVVKALSRVRAVLKAQDTVVKELAEAQKKVTELAAMPEQSREKKKGYIDVLEKLEELIETQMARIAMGRGIEDKVKYLIKTLTQDIGEARELLKLTFEVQQELHIQPKRPTEIRLTEGKALSFDARQRIGKALDLIRRKLQQGGVKEANLDEATGAVMSEVFGLPTEVSETTDEVIDVVPMEKSLTGEVLIERSGLCRGVYRRRYRRRSYRRATL